MGTNNITIGTLTHDNLIAGIDQYLEAAEGVLASGAKHTQGEILGKIRFAIDGAVADDGNTGDGEITGEALGYNFEAGEYVVECVDGTVPATFSVTSPSGVVLKEATAEAAYKGQIEFKVEAGTAAFAEGDLFTVEVKEFVDGKLVLLNESAVDGSQRPYGILATDVDATTADTKCVVYLSGRFNKNKLSVAALSSVDNVLDELRRLGIYVRPSVFVTG